MRSGICYVLCFFYFYQLLRNGDSFIPLKIGQIDRRLKRCDFDELWFSLLNYCNWYLMRNCRWKRNVRNKCVSVWLVCFGYGSINLHGIRLSMVLFDEWIHHWWMTCIVHPFYTHCWFKAFGSCVCVCVWLGNSSFVQRGMPEAWSNCQRTRNTMQK